MVEEESDLSATTGEQREIVPLLGQDTLDDLAGDWYASFTLFHRNTIREVCEFPLLDPKIQGSGTFTPADLDRVIARAHEMEAWIGAFEMSSGNPISVIALVESWPEGDTQNRPRLVTAYWPHWNGPNESPREGALALMKRFEANPFASLILRDIEASNAADQALQTVFPDTEKD